MPIIDIVSTEDIIRRKIRKHCNTLYILGTGVIALGLWGALKVVLLFANNPAAILGDAIKDSLLSNSEIILVCVIILIPINILLLLYIFVGHHARAEGKGQKKRAFYIIVIAFLAFIYSVSAIFDVFALFVDLGDNITLEEIIVTTIVDTTASVTLIELFCSAIMIRKYRRIINTRDK